MTCDSNTQFNALIYPKLVEVQNRGVQVVLVGGDVGMQKKSLSYQTREGVWLLGSGINNSLKRENAPEYVKDFGPDEILSFSFNPAMNFFEAFKLRFILGTFLLSLLFFHFQSWSLTRTISIPH